MTEPERYEIDLGMVEIKVLLPEPAPSPESPPSPKEGEL